MIRRYSFLPVLTLAAAASLFAACDSGDPIDEVACDEVEGRYTVTAFEFDPDAPAFESISFLDTLDVTQTELRLTDRCQYVFTYKFKERNTELVTGGFRVSESIVRLEVDEEDQERLADLYLGSNISFERLGSQILESAVRTRVNLGDFDPDYEGVEADGDIRFRLERP